MNGLIKDWGCTFIPFSLSSQDDVPGGSLPMWPLGLRVPSLVPRNFCSPCSLLLEHKTSFLRVLRKCLWSGIKMQSRNGERRAGPGKKWGERKALEYFAEAIITSSLCASWELLPAATARGRARVPILLTLLSSAVWPQLPHISNRPRREDTAS